MASSKPRTVASEDRRPTRVRARAALQVAERTRHACIEVVRKVSLYGPRGVGRKSTGEVQEEILTQLRGLDLSFISSHSTDRDEPFGSMRNTAGKFTSGKIKPGLVA